MSMPEQDRSEELRTQVESALQAQQGLSIQAGGSKDFYGHQCAGKRLDPRAHRGIVNYQPKELVITLRAGTPLAEAEAVLAEQGQVLPFEPPHFADGATVGGMEACVLSGPARAAAGSVRDYVLGVRIINGRAEILHFGGEVMKNVAGYDVSRLMVGALGTLGVILETSFKVLPRPAAQQTRVLGLEPQQALEQVNRMPALNYPLTASFHDGERLYLRLAGTESAVQESGRRIGGELLDDAGFWNDVREQSHQWFQSDLALWRLSVPSLSPWLELPGTQCFEWDGALRWLMSDQPAESIRSAVDRAGGHATLFRRGDPASDVFHPLDPVMSKLQRSLKQAFDPSGLFNRGRMYREF